MDDDNGSVNKVDVRKLELFTIVMIKTLKRNNKKMRKEEVLSLIQESIDCEKKLRKF